MKLTEAMASAFDAQITLEFEASLMVHLVACADRSDDLRQAVAAAADHAALAAIDLEAGWP